MSSGRKKGEDIEILGDIYTQVNECGDIRYDFVFHILGEGSGIFGDGARGIIRFPVSFGNIYDLGTREEYERFCCEAYP